METSPGLTGLDSYDNFNSIVRLNFYIAIIKIFDDIPVKISGLHAQLLLKKGLVIMVYMTM